jgi:acyl carrier protein/acetyltransferase-like isoleucine patch superfamily enzyme
MRVGRSVARVVGRAVDAVESRVAFGRDAQLGAAVRTLGRPGVSCRGRLVIGPGAVFVSRPAPIQIVVDPGATLVIGEDALVESGVTLRVRSEVTVGDRARIGHGCILDDEGLPPRPIAVGARAWIEDGVVLLGGAHVAPGAIVARGTVLGASMHVQPRAAPVPGGDRGTHRAVEDRVRGVIARIVPAAARIPAEADLRSYMGWDSLAALRVLVALEREFGLSFPYDMFVQAPRIAAVLPHLVGRSAVERSVKEAR